MSVGMILLVIVAVLTLFGVSQRVLDRMRLSDRGALLVAAAIFIGGFIPNIRFTPDIQINVGGAIIPIILCVYLFIKAGSTKEKVRTIVGVIITSGAIYALGRLLPAEAENTVIDPNIVYGLVGGVVAYILGRSRRGAFICGVMGVLLADVINTVVLASQGRAFLLRLGGAGAFDAVVIAGLLAVLLAEGLGELIERMRGGSEKEKHLEFRDGEFREKARGSVDEK